MRWIALKTLLRRECGVIGRYWFVTLAPPAVSTILYFAIFGRVLGERIGPMDDVPYVEYMTPGLIALAVVPYAFSHSAAGLLGARMFGYLEELLVAPQPRWIILVSHVFGGVVRGLLVALVCIAIALLFSEFGRLSGSTALALLLVAAVSALGGFIAGLIGKSFEQMSLIQGVILVPLAIFGGVFTPVSDWPEWAQSISRFNPVFYMVSGLRSGICGISEVDAGVAFLILAMLGVILLLIALRLLRGEVLNLRESTDR